MARPTIKRLVNCDDPSEKRRMQQQVGVLRGVYRFSAEPARPIRSLRQNRFYWGCVVEPFVEFLRDQDYDITTPDEAHELLKSRFLTVPVTERGSGVPIGSRVRSTTDLTTAEMHDYIERCRAFLADFFGIETMDPDPEATHAERTSTVRPSAN